MGLGLWLRNSSSYRLWLRCLLGLDSEVRMWVERVGFYNSKITGSNLVPVMVHLIAIMIIVIIMTTTAATTTTTTQY